MKIINAVPSTCARGDKANNEADTLDSKTIAKDWFDHFLSPLGSDFRLDDGYGQSCIPDSLTRPIESI
jgi:hypothetical protein